MVNQTSSFWSFTLCPTKSIFFRKFLMTSLHVIYGLALPLFQKPGYPYAFNHVQYAYQIPVIASYYCWRTFTSGCLQHCIDAKQQNIRCIASSLKFVWYGNMESKIEEKFTIEWKIFNMEWKWNRRKLPVWNMEKSSSIPCHTMHCRQHTSNKIAYQENFPVFFYTKYD